MIKKQFFLILVILGYLFTNSVFSKNNTQRLNHRQILDFNQNWLFEKDDWVGLNNASQEDWNDNYWEKIRLPHSWNANDTFDNEQGYYRGFGWYRKHFKIGKELKGRKLYLRFGAIYVGAEIWVNGNYFGPFNSGYTPIQIDITECVDMEKKNLIAIRVNNIHNDEIPPGRWRMDYNCYGGIYREVELISLSPVHLSENELFVTTPVVDQKFSQISVQIGVKNNTNVPRQTKVVCELFDGTKSVAKFSQSMQVPAGLNLILKNLKSSIKNTKLWSPESPYLYSLKITLFNDKNEAIDDLITKVGFRDFYFDSNKGFFLNGKHLELKGLNRHQCYPGLANAVPKRLQIEDVKILKDLGANFIRCSHYPQHPDLLNACDELGLLVYGELASWQHIGGEKFIGIMDQMMKEMICRDRNHPSIILWGLMNEGRSKKMFERIQRTTKRLDPTRPTIYAENHIKEAIELGTAFIPDVLGLNYKLQKYDELHQNYPHLKLTNSECTNPDGSILGDLETELAGLFKIKNDLDLIESRDYLGGACIWSMHDYGTEYKPVRPIQKSGVIDVYRRYKEAAYYLKSRWHKEPFIHISGHWTFPDEVGKIKDVYVWSNCDKVKLFLNGEIINKNTDEPNLWQVSYEPGELKAVGKKGRSEVKYILKTAGNPAKIVLSTLSSELVADGFDAIPFEAKIVDQNGVIVPLNKKIVSFGISGLGKLIGIGGETKVRTAKGSAIILVQSTGNVGTIYVTAKAEGLKLGQFQIIANK